MSIRRSAVATLSIVGVFLLAGSSSAATEGKPDGSRFEQYFVSGRLADEEKAIQQILKEEPKDDEARLALGAIQFVRAVEGVSQDLYRFGARAPRTMSIPILRLAHGKNPKPEKLSYEKARAVLQEFVDRLAQAEKTLSGIEDRHVKVAIPVGQVRMDLDGSGEAEEKEALAKVLSRVMRGRAGSEAMLLKMTIAFDRGDVHWLRGYCHLLMGFSEVVLAHDGKELFQRTAQLFFPNLDTPHPYLKHTDHRRAGWWDFEELADAIALIHLINLPVKEPARMKAALKHFKAVIAQSRQSWQAISQEMDDDREWIPSPRQSSVLPGMRVSEEMVSGWSEFLVELKAILDGKKLVPFWRGKPGARGVNINKVFTDPHRFDLVLWIQGSGAAPFLEKGSLTEPKFWNRLNRTFRGNFVGFAIWFN